MPPSLPSGKKEHRIWVQRPQIPSQDAITGTRFKIPTWNYQKIKQNFKKLQKKGNSGLRKFEHWGTKNYDSWDMIKKMSESYSLWKVSAVLHKISEVFFIDIEKLILKYVWKCKTTRIVKTTLKKKSKFGGLILFQDLS